MKSDGTLNIAACVCACVCINAMISENVHDIARADGYKYKSEGG